MALKLSAPRARLEEPEHPFEGFLMYQGIPIDVETACGNWRRGVSDDGEAWACRMVAHYGEVRNTIGADGDALDVFVGDEPYAPFVFVIRTKFPGQKSFDECKCMLGFPTRAAAISAFRRSYGKAGFYLGCTKWPIGSFKAALSRPHLIRGRMTKPLRRAHVRRDLIPGGEADRLDFRSLDPGELQRGTEHELEHTSDRRIAREIAADHLAEDPLYYQHLEAMEERVDKLRKTTTRRDLFDDNMPPAPNYRASDDGTLCSTCWFHTGGHCRAYDFGFAPGYTCDTWSADVANLEKGEAAEETVGEEPGDPGGILVDDRELDRLAAKREPRAKSGRAVVRKSR